MDEITLNIKDICGSNIYTRADGRILYQSIRKALKTSIRVILEFNGQEIASESFLDEAIVEHYLQPEFPDIAERLILRHVTRPDQLLLGRILEYRKRLSQKEAKRLAKINNHSH